MTGTFFFCGNCHPLMRDDAFLLHVLCLPLSPAQACIGEVPSSASCIGRPSSALHMRLLRLKLSHKKRDDIDADKFFLSRQKCRTGEIWTFCGMLPLFSLSPFLGADRLLPSFFFFAFLSPVSFSSDAVLHVRGVFFFLAPLKKRKKKLLSREEKKASRTIFLRRFYFSFSLFVSFSLSPPCPFPDGFPEEGNPSSLIRRLFHFGKRREKRKKKGFPCLFLHSGKTEERHAENKGRFRIQKRKRDGRRDGCSRHPLLSTRRQNFAYDGRFRTKTSNSSYPEEKRPDGEFRAFGVMCHFDDFLRKKKKRKDGASLLF